MPSVTIPGLGGTISIAELSLAVIAVAFAIAVIVLLPVLVQVRRTASRAERLLTSVDGQLPGLIQDVRAMVFKIDRTTDSLRDLSKSLERFERFVNTAVDTVEKTRDTARQMAREFILPSMANAAGVLALIREGAELIRPKREREREGSVMSERGDFMAGVLFGALLGVGIGLLIAPGTGEETRTRLRREGEELQKRARVQADRVVDRVRKTADDVADRLRTGADDVVTRARNTAEDVVERGRATLEEKSERLRRAFDTGRETIPGQGDDKKRPSDKATRDDD